MRTSTAPTTDDLMEYAAFASFIADITGNIIMRNLANGLSFESKSDQSPVTVVDRQVEMEIRKRIGQRYPEHGILGEELAATDIDRDLVWVIDPIDGTKAFIGGIPVFGTLISLTFRGDPVVGVIDHPYTRERWIGIDGFGTTYNGQRVQTRTYRPLSECVMFSGNPEPFTGTKRSAFDRIRDNVKFCVYGTSCYGYGRLANGAMDIGIETANDPFDFCALVPVVRNAGGWISDWQGRPLTIHSEGSYIASNSRQVHESCLELLVDGHLPHSN
jgi:histidinol phosphatase-like enzyme (inositol monophosphatase family)